MTALGFDIDLIHEARLHGWLEGYHSRDDELAQTTWTADRLYTEMCRRTPPRQPELTSFEELQRRRYGVSE